MIDFSIVDDIILCDLVKACIETIKTLTEIAGL